MPDMFGVQFNKVFGTAGDFNIENGDHSIRARYLLTKFRPGSDGAWENELASHMVPWREVFNIEELTFEELLQRDLDDSRVAHELIPYLLGETGAIAKFFPPILAVIVPKNGDGSGINEKYPEPSVDDSGNETYGNLFSFEHISWDGKLTPLASLGYNSQKAAFVIVDGQHRAMAALAIHRQMTDTWRENPYAAYYRHINVSPSMGRKLELPVCLVYFPDVHEGNMELANKRIDLKRVCREIFVVVNRNAKPISASRELLLDDDDLAAYLMRRTMSHLKNRGEDNFDLARIYSFSYGDANPQNQQVVSGLHEYSSAVALHKLHCAMSFGYSEGFQLQDYSDISDGRYVRNPNRPVSILLNTDLDGEPSISRTSARYFPAQKVDQIINLLGTLNDIVLLGLFDRFLPFSVHNHELRNLKGRLQDSNVRADLIQNKCLSLLFEGSGVRDVFEQHRNRLQDLKKDGEKRGETIGDSIINQIEYAQSVLKAVELHQSEFRKRRACRLFSIDYSTAYGNIDLRDDVKKIEQADRSIYSTISTQAFQLGFVMAIFSVAEYMLTAEDGYDERKKVVIFLTDFYLKCLNHYFSPKENVIHKKIKGFVDDDRSGVFDQNRSGLRALLSMSKNELNEKCWDFFRYSILEIIHSTYCNKILKEYLNKDDAINSEYKKILPNIVTGICDSRKRYIKAASTSSLNAKDFKIEILQAEAQAKGEGKTEDEIEIIIEKKRKAKIEQIEKKAADYLASSLGKVSDCETMLSTLL